MAMEVVVSVGYDGQRFYVRHGQVEGIVGFSADVARNETEAWSFMNHGAVERFVDTLAYDEIIWSEAARQQAEAERAQALWNERVNAGVGAVDIRAVFDIDMSANPMTDLRAIVETILKASDKILYLREVPLHEPE